MGPRYVLQLLLSAKLLLTQQQMKLEEKNIKFGMLTMVEIF